MKIQFKLCKIPTKIGGVKSTILVLREMFMFVTTVCQPEYLGNFEVMSVAEYHQSFIQKKVKENVCVQVHFR